MYTKHLFYNSSFIHVNFKLETFQISIAGELIRKLWYVPIPQHLIVKINELLIHSITWMNFQSVMKSKGSQTQKTTYCMIPFALISRIAKTNRPVASFDQMG
jgi:hypothetical protein